MKKFNFAMLHLILALVLIGLGILIELNGTKSVKGTAGLFLIVPGVTLLAGFFMEYIKAKRFYLYALVPMTIALAADVILWVSLKLPVTPIMVLCVIVLDGIAVGISILFLLIYQNVSEHKVKNTEKKTKK